MHKSEFGSPEFDMEDSRGVFRIKQTGTIKYELHDGVQYNYTNNNDIASLYFVKASNTNIGNYINNSFTSNYFEFRKFTALTDNYFFRYDTSNDETTIPNKLILSASTNQISNGTYDYILPSNNGTLALTTDIATSIFTVSNSIITPTTSSNNIIKLLNSTYDSAIIGDVANPSNTGKPYIKYGSFETLYGKDTRHISASIQNFSSGFRAVNLTCNANSDILEISNGINVNGNIECDKIRLTDSTNQISTLQLNFTLPNQSGTLALTTDGLWEQNINNTTRLNPKAFYTVIGLGSGTSNYINLNPDVRVIPSGLLSEGRLISYDSSKGGGINGSIIFGSNSTSSSSGWDTAIYGRHTVNIDCGSTNVAEFTSSGIRSTGNFGRLTVKL